MREALWCPVWFGHHLELADGLLKHLSWWDKRTLSHHSIRLEQRESSSSVPANTSSSSTVIALLLFSSPTPACLFAAVAAARYLMARNGISLACYPTQGSDAYSIALVVISHKDTLSIPAAPPPPTWTRGERDCQHSQAPPHPCHEELKPN